eukprot:TRINITY_DN2330_c0_g1_i3.p1 TRINITY_DN2330_c0_g1~~TRINITY_DN2330_c0_g1_i3.p1  ORF type:complete len:128 (-),score=38.41 TRINITY_DN2330_c0_g1_i3:31-414(-)
MAPALFMTVRFGYEEQVRFCTDAPAAMLWAQVLKRCMITFPDQPALEKFDLKETGGGAALGLADMGLEYASERVKSRGVYDLVGFTEEGEEYAMCQEKPLPPEPEEPEEPPAEGEDGQAGQAPSEEY